MRPIRLAAIHHARFIRATVGGSLTGPLTMQEIEAAAAELGVPAYLTDAELLARAADTLDGAERATAARRAELAQIEAIRPGQSLGWRHGYATATQAWIDEWLAVCRALLARAEAAEAEARDAVAALTPVADRRAA